MGVDVVPWVVRHPAERVRLQVVNGEVHVVRVGILGGEDQVTPIGRPARGLVVVGIVCDLAGGAAVGVHDVNFGAVVPDRVVGHVGDQSAIRRPLAAQVVEVVRVGQAEQVAAVRAGAVEFLEAITRGREDDPRAVRRPIRVEVVRVVGQRVFFPGGYVHHVQGRERAARAGIGNLGPIRRPGEEAVVAIFRGRGDQARSRCHPPPRRTFRRWHPPGRGGCRRAGCHQGTSAARSCYRAAWRSGGTRRWRASRSGPQLVIDVGGDDQGAGWGRARGGSNTIAATSTKTSASPAISAILRRRHGGPL